MADEKKNRKKYSENGECEIAVHKEKQARGKYPELLNRHQKRMGGN
jgi:hypothetical protein